MKIILKFRLMKAAKLSPCFPLGLRPLISPHEPVVRRSDPIVVVSSADNPGQEDQRNLGKDPALEALRETSVSLISDHATSDAAISSQAPSTQRWITHHHQ